MFRSWKRTCNFCMMNVIATLASIQIGIQTPWISIGMSLRCIYTIIISPVWWLGERRRLWYSGYICRTVVAGWLYCDRACSGAWNMCFQERIIGILSFLQIYLNLLKFLAQLHRSYVVWHFALKKINDRRNTLFSITMMSFEPTNLRIPGKRLIH